jgi:tetratricopeptide (TPR) repeat protein
VNDLESDLSEFTKTMHREWLQRRLPKRSMAVLLNIEGKISTLRAKPAHLVGHLPLVAYSLHGLANIYRMQDKTEQAGQFYERALHIREQTLGHQHPETAVILYDFAIFWEARGNKLKAESLYQRALTIQEQTLGSQHPTTVATQISYTRLLRGMGCDEEVSDINHSII